MEVSPQDPSLMAMDLSKGYSVTPLTRSHPEAMDLAKKPEWYHRRPPGCSSELGSTFRSRASSSYNPEPGAAVHCRDLDQGPESLGNYMNSTLAPGLDLYRDGVHGGLWHPGFYGPEPSGGPVLESSGGEESDSGSGSDVIFLVSSAKEPLLCSSFIQENVRHIVEPLSPAASSLDGDRGCYHLPQPLSSPSPDSSDSEESSDSSVDIPVHHTRPVVLLSDLGAVYNNAVESPVDISSDDSDVIEVSVTNEKKTSKDSPRKKSEARETPPQSEEEKPPPRRVRRSPRIRKPSSETPPPPPPPPPDTCRGSRYSLRRQAKNNVVGIYNESCDSDEMMDYGARLYGSDGDESQQNVSQRASSDSEESDVDRKSPQVEQRPPPRRKETHAKNVKRKKPLTLPQAKRLRTKQTQNDGGRTPAATEQQPKKKTTKKPVRRKKKGRSQTGPSSLFPPTEPEIKLKYANFQKKTKKVESFCPFVHVKKRSCTVVNYQEEEATVRSSRAPDLRTSGSLSGALSGFVPSTSCFQLGRFSPDGRCDATLLCCLCGQTANSTGLGDLHGPYYRVSPPERREQRQDEVVSRRSVNSSDGDDGSNARTEEDESSVSLGLDEGWIHEDCSIWSAGVFLVRGRLYGLEEAAAIAQKTTCSVCQLSGAIMGCFQKGCSRNYHYRCAIQSGCVLNEENFSLRCPEHKNKLLTSVRHKR